MFLGILVPPLFLSHLADSLIALLACGCLDAPLNPSHQLLYFLGGLFLQINGKQWPWMMACCSDLLRFGNTLAK